VSLLIWVSGTWAVAALAEKNKASIRDREQLFIAFAVVNLGKAILRGREFSDTTFRNESDNFGLLRLNQAGRMN